MKTKSWDEFRETGLFVFVNSFLHIFGWAIVLEINDGKVKSVYPKKVSYCGFPPETMDKAYLRIKKYIGLFEEEEVEESLSFEEAMEQRKLNEDKFYKLIMDKIEEQTNNEKVKEDR